MNKIRDKLPNANKWCHIYTDEDGITNIHNTQTNETYRIIPDTSALGIQIERHTNGKLSTRNTLSFEELKVLADLAGSNQLLRNLADKGGETLETPKKEITIDDALNSVHTNNEVITTEDYVVIEHDENDNLKLLEIATTLPRALRCRNFNRDKIKEEYPLIDVFKILDNDNLIIEELNK